MALPISVTYAPMEAKVSRTIPGGDGWLYEPKWDGFRCLVFRDGDEVDLRSKANKPLGRYFPEMVELIKSVKAKEFVLDGELVVPVDGILDFDELLQRIHPAESRVRKLAKAHPSNLVVFDLLVDADGNDLTKLPLSDRRKKLEAFSKKYLDNPALRLSPQTDDQDLAERWLAGELGGLDGVVAKQAYAAYATGERTAMKKVKRMRTADCVVGGFRWSSSGGTIGSLLLGLYGDDGLLHHVGFCSALTAKTRPQAEEHLLPLRGGEGFTGRAPGGPSRWRTEGSGAFEAVRPEVVVEVEYDHYSGGRFRHGTRFLRWRPDKEPGQCTLDQVERERQNA